MPTTRPGPSRDPRRTASGAATRSASQSDLIVRSLSGAQVPLEPPSASHRQSVRRALLALAARPRYGVTLALAGSVAQSWHSRGLSQLPLFGLDADTTWRMLGVHFPGLDRLMGPAWGQLCAPEVFQAGEALDDLVALLVRHRTIADEDGTWLAHAVATACLWDEALWRGLGLPAPEVLDDLLYGFFTTLCARNRRGLPWEHFFLQVLGEQLPHHGQLNPAGRERYERCFGLAGAP